MNKTINSRVTMKHDIEANWLKAVNFKPMPGEIIVYDKDEKHDFVRTKIGALDENGEAINVNDLPFVKNAIIDVVSLPTENINQEAIYRVLDTVAYDYGDPLYDPKINYVDTLPEEGENVIDFETEELSFYYNISDGLVYCYVNEELSAAAGAEGMDLPVGWYPYDTFATLVGGLGTMILNIYTLPEQGMPAMNLDTGDSWVYYHIGENEVYCYIDETLSQFINGQFGMTIAIGWYPYSQLSSFANVNYQGIFTKEEDIPNEGFSILVNNVLYTYNKSWALVDTKPIQSDFLQFDSDKPDYIRNSPLRYTNDGIKINKEYLYQADWNVNNSNEPTAIKNRPFGLIPTGTLIHSNNNVNCTTTEYGSISITEGFCGSFNLTENGYYKIICNGVTSYGQSHDNVIEFSNPPSFLTSNGQMTNVPGSTSGYNTIYIYAAADIIQTIKQEYLPFNLVAGIEDNNYSVPISSVLYQKFKEIDQKNNSQETQLETQASNIVTLQNNQTILNNQIQETVRTTIPQTLTSTQQSTARKNINAQEQISITSPLKYGDSVYLENGTGLILKGKTVYKNMCSVNTTGEFTQMAVYDIEPLEPGIYTFSCYVETSNPSNVGVIHFLNSKGNEISSTMRTLQANNGKRNIQTINFDETITQLRVYSGQTWNEATGHTATFYDIQMEASHIATDYEPYQTSQTGIGARIMFNTSVFSANETLMDGDSLDFINKTLTRADGSISSITTLTNPKLSNFVKSDYTVRTNGEALLTYNYLPLVSYNPQKITDPQRLTVRKTLQITGKPGGNESSCFGYSTIASGRYSFAEGVSTKALNEAAHAEGYNAEASGWISHAEGHKTIASGERSHAEGYLTSAENLASHAEGQQTVASGQWSHAEGLASKATNNSAHAEGNNCQATNTAAHAEGVDTIAKGYASHAEGSKTEATSYYAHAEGYSAKAQGNYAHAEGRYTIAKGDTQHVQGKYNIELGSTYAHIVGNGESEEKRSNAHTLDWNGNAWYAGSIQGTNFIITNSDGSTTSLGDLNTALETILAIQEELINPSINTTEEDETQ